MIISLFEHRTREINEVEKNEDLVDENDLNIPEVRGKITVSVVGCERSGLIMACLLADIGFKVFCVDSDQSIVNQVMRGESPFPEPGLKSLLEKNVREGRLLATTDIKESVTHSNIILLFVSPKIDEKKRPDYSNIEKMCRDVGLNLRCGALIILESNVAPGVTETLVKETLETASGLKAGIGFGLAYCSARDIPSEGLQNIINDPKVFSGIDKKSSDLTKAFWRTFTKGEVVEVSSIKTAEAVGLFENVYQDVNVAFSNELAFFCEKAGIDFMEVRNAVNLRSHRHLSVPEIVDGYISDGPYLLIEEAENLKMRLRMATLARKVNNALLNQVFYLVRDALRSCGRSVKRARILVLGVSCRPNEKELKGSRVKELVEILLNKGMFVKVYDPLFSYKELAELGYPAERTFTEAVKGTDCLLIAVGHDRFRRLNLRRIRLLMRKPSAIVDVSYVVDPSEVEEKGFIYRGLGRGVRGR